MQQDLNNMDDEKNQNMIFKRPWGEYQVLYAKDDISNYQVKKIVVQPKQSLSLQTHEKRAEIWVIVQGEGSVVLGDDEVVVKVGDVVKIAVAQKHRMRNTGEKELIFIETQLGEYLGEDDIRRYEDDYDRI